MNNRKYMILDTRSKGLVVDETGEPLRFVTLAEAITDALERNDVTAPDAHAVLDDLGNKWLWSAKGVLRIAISYEAKDAVTEVVDKGYDWKQITYAVTARVRPDGIVETQHQVRLADGPPVYDPTICRHGETTTQRWSDKRWIERASLASYIDHLPTRVHKLEERAMNGKARSTRAAEKAKLQLAAYEAGDEMTCQLCGRLICSKFGTIAHHGYTRPGDGWQSPSCSGTHEVPFEVSNAALVAGIEDLEAYGTRLRQQIADVGAGIAPVVVSVPPHWSSGRNSSYTFAVKAETYAAVAAKSDGRLDVKVAFEHRRESFIYELEERIRAVKGSLGEMRKRNAGWKQTRVFIDGEFKPFVCEAA